MPKRMKKPCNQPGCNELTTERYCDKHRRNNPKRQDRHKVSSTQRGYGYRWRKAREQFLLMNPYCALRLPGCTGTTQCVDHIDPPDSRNDPRFWDSNNWQPSCVHCNSVKGKRRIVGRY